MKIYRMPGHLKVGDTILVGLSREKKTILSVSTPLWEKVEDGDYCIYQSDRASFVTVTV